MNNGKIVQVLGPVVDVEFFEGSDLPRIKDALEVDNDGKRCVMEVAQHMGNSTVRCIMLASSEGLYKGMEVTATGEGIKVPVGEQTLGRLLMSLERPLIMEEPYREARSGSFTEILRPLRSRARWLRSWKQGSRSLICWPLMQKAERSVCSAVPVWEKRF